MSPKIQGQIAPASPLPATRGAQLLASKWLFTRQFVPPTHVGINRPQRQHTDASVCPTHVGMNLG